MMMIKVVLTKEGPKVINFYTKWGVLETQALLPLVFPDRNVLVAHRRQGVPPSYVPHNDLAKFMMACVTDECSVEMKMQQLWRSKSGKLVTTYSVVTVLVQNKVVREDPTEVAHVPAVFDAGALLRALKSTRRLGKYSSKGLKNCDNMLTGFLERSQLYYNNAVINANEVVTTGTEFASFVGVANTLAEASNLYPAMCRQLIQLHTRTALWPFVISVPFTMYNQVGRR